MCPAVPQFRIQKKQFQIPKTVLLVFFQFLFVIDVGYVQVKKCGVDFRWNLFGMTEKDADNVAIGLESTPNLTTIRYNVAIRLESTPNHQVQRAHWTGEHT
jgi:hypothetical protein